MPDSSPFVRLPSRRVKTGRASLERARLTRVDARFLPNIPPLFFRASIPKLSICTPPPLSRRSGRSRAPSLVPHPTHHLFVPRPSSSAQDCQSRASSTARTGARRRGGSSCSRLCPTKKARGASLQSRSPPRAAHLCPPADDERRPTRQRPTARSRPRERGRGHRAAARPWEARRSSSAGGQRRAARGGLLDWRQNEDGNGC